jgi:hypothetical protein
LCHSFNFQGKSEKNQKSKGVFGKEMKSFRKESKLIFYQKLGERGVLSPFRFCLSTPLKGKKPSTRAKKKKSENEKVLKICFYINLSR